MRITDTGDLWWKNAVVYCLDVETYMDWNDDGVGDFPGLAQRLDHLAELGVTCLWLMPFYPSARRDDGYDVTDFYGVDPRLGTHGDVVELIRTARDRGMRVIADLVVNHTSDQHPWFVAARSSKDNPFRDYYVWRSDEPPPTADQVVFPDQEDSIWQLDDATGEWYLHHFYRHQPDLNIANPAVRDEIAKVMGFWLELGLSGFRVDAVPYLLEGNAASAAGSGDRGAGAGAGARASEKAGVGAGGDDAGDPHDYLRSLRSFLGRRSGDAILLGEVNLPHEEQLRFFGDGAGDELTMMFDFIGMQSLYLALARADAGPLADALCARPRIPTDSQWATFVRNHDELTLDKLGEAERQEVFDAFGPEESMQLFGRGLRRRLPPMLAGDPRRIRMVYSLLFSLPGTPVLFYGEEIGMGENLGVPGRSSVRTPMQWTGQENGGFSRADPANLVLPVVTGGFGPEHVNVAAQRNDPDSLLNFIGHLVRRYRECPELGWSRATVLDQPHAQVLAHRCTWDDASLVAVHNLGPEPCVVPLRLDEEDGGTELVDLLAEGRVRCDDDGSVEVALEGYGYRWLRVVRPGSRRLV